MDTRLAVLSPNGFRTFVFSADSYGTRNQKPEQGFPFETHTADGRYYMVLVYTWYYTAEEGKSFQHTTPTTAHDISPNRARDSVKPPYAPQL